MDDRIILAHGSGGKMSHDLIKESFLPLFANPLLEKLDDSASLDFNGRLAFTTDSYVVNPIFFPGGDIGELAVCGTINDLAMVGASPLHMSIALIIEEGLLLTDLNNIISSIALTAESSKVNIITGDTKVVDHGMADKLFINTSGIGIIPSGIDISGCNARPGDSVILSGTIGDHGIAIMSQREGLSFTVPIVSDCAPLNQLVDDMLQVSPNIHCLRDPTRGGLATALNELAISSGVGFFIEENAIPVAEPVRAACELLGLDPLYVANEGKLIAVLPESEAEAVLSKMRSNPYGLESAIIGKAIEKERPRVIMRTTMGTTRLVDMLAGDLLPRIC